MKAPKRFFKKIINAVNNFMAVIKEDSISAYSAQAAFFVIISAIPLIMLLLTLLRFVPYFNSGDIIFDFDMLPHDLNEFLGDILREIISKSSNTLISISAITALWSASKGVYSMMQGLTAAYSLHETRSYLRMRGLSIIYTIVLLVVIIAALGFLVFGNSIYDTLIDFLPIAAEHVRIISKGIRWLIAFGFLLLFFEAMYLMMPNHKSTIIRELPGALVSSIGWVVFSYGYSYYIDNFSNYSNIYGSLTAVVLLMLWLYFCMYIMLVGAEINEAWNDTYKRIVARIFRKTKKKIKKTQ